jgi:excisionase family DNA binding protein
MSGPTPPNQDLLTVEEVANEFRHTPQTIRNWIKSGLLPAIRISHVYRVRRSDVDVLRAKRQGIDDPPSGGSGHRPESTSPAGARDPWAPETLALPVKRQ